MYKAFQMSLSGIVIALVILLVGNRLCSLEQATYVSTIVYILVTASFVTVAATLKTERVWKSEAVNTLQFVLQMIIRFLLGIQLGQAR